MWLFTHPQDRQIHPEREEVIGLSNSNIKLTGVSVGKR